MANFSDDDLKIAIQQLKPKTNWLAIIASSAAVAGAVWTATQYLGNTVKREELAPVKEDITRIRIELPTVSGRVERVEMSQQRVEKTIDRIEEKLDERKDRRGR